MNSESIFRATFRTFFMAFGAIIGLCLGFVFVMLLLGGFSSGSPEAKPTTVYSQYILPNAKGERVVESDTAPVILQINIDGIIGTELLDTKTIRQMLVESREGDYKNDRIKGILLYINSPGGTVVDADGIYRALVAYKEKYKVPVYAFVDGLCASGGVYVSLAADKVYASEVSMVGSVGVIAPTFVNVSKLLETYGISSLTISAGKDKDAMNPLRPWKPGEDENYRQIIDYYYQNFVALVAKHRPNLSKEKLVADYGARVFPASEAKTYGYIDFDNSTLQDALNALLQETGLENTKYQFIRFENKQWWQSLFSSQSPLFTGKVTHTLSLTPELDVMMQHKFLYLYQP